MPGIATEGDYEVLWAWAKWGSRFSEGLAFGALGRKSGEVRFAD